MVKNSDILKAFEKSEKQKTGPSGAKKDWYKKADEMYNLALTLNPSLFHSKSEKHLQMLIEVRKKINSIAKNS